MNGQPTSSIRFANRSTCSLNLFKPLAGSETHLPLTLSRTGAVNVKCESGVERIDFWTSRMSDRVQGRSMLCAVQERVVQ